MPFNWILHFGDAIALAANSFSGRSDSDPDESQYDQESFDKEEDLKYYFHRGFTYQEIILFLSERHQHQLSYSMLLQRLRKYGLGRRGMTGKGECNDTFCKVQWRMAELINGPCSSGGSNTLARTWNGRSKDT